MVDIEKIKITDIVPASYNPRSISDEELLKLRNSIDEFGLVDPLIINLKNNKIIGGHQRFDVLINQYMVDNDFYAELNLLRFGDIGWVFTDTDLKIESEEHEKALNLALNKISGEWDFEKLVNILDDLEINDFNIDLTGFEDFEVEEIKSNIEENIINDEKDTPYTDNMRDFDEDTSEKDSLKRDFIMPPFSILRAYDKDWQDLKKKMINEVNDYAESREEVMGDFGTSLFDPVLAKIMLTWFVPNVENPKIFDCFAGGAAIGTVSSILGYTFTGIELRQEQADLNNERLKNTKSKYICDDGQNVLNHIDENSQDFLFSCPPYFDLEVYSDLKNDASNQDSYEDFLKILDNAYTNSIKCLKENRFAVVVIGNVRDKNGFYYPMTADIINIFKKADCYLYNDIILADPLGTAPVRARKTFKNRKVVKVHQNVLVFFKGNPDKIQELFKIK